jgi:hypothetical protein
MWSGLLADEEATGLNFDLSSRVIFSFCFSVVPLHLIVTVLFFFVLIFSSLNHHLTCYPTNVHKTGLILKFVILNSFHYMGVISVTNCMTKK